MDKDRENQRRDRLKRLFEDVLSGKRSVQSRADGMLFIESIIQQPIPAICITRVATNVSAISTLQACMSFNVSLDFLNNRASDLLKYLQDKTIKDIDDESGSVLPKIVAAIAANPLFWNSFLKEFKAGSMEARAQQCFGWLLSEIIALPEDNSLPYRNLAKDLVIQKLFSASPDLDVRNAGQKIKHAISLLECPSVKMTHKSCFAGGRHDNDFSDFRKISILPTPDEIMSSESAFIRVASAIEEPDAEGNRVAIHLDNQFRLLREDMVGILREDVQIVLGKKKGKRGVVVETQKGFTVTGSACDKRWGVKIQLDCGIPRFKNISMEDRRKFLKSSSGRNFFKHEALIAVIISKQLVSFATNRRDEDLLARDPPTIILEFEEKELAKNTLIKLNTCNDIKLVQIDASLFSYEPILRRLQQIRELPLSDEILDWKPGQKLNSPSDKPTEMIEKLLRDPYQDLKNLLDLDKKVCLDRSQYESLMMGLTQKVSLIQGPPGTGKSFIGGLLAKTLFKYTKKKILVVCYTNHALDQFIEDLLKVGVPGNAVTRLGSKCTDATRCLLLNDQAKNARHGLDTFNLIMDMRSQADGLKTRLDLAVKRFSSTATSNSGLMDYLEFFSDDVHSFFSEFTVSDENNGFQKVGDDGKTVGKFYLLDRWRLGRDAGVYNDSVSTGGGTVWDMPYPERRDHVARWEHQILEELISEIYDIGAQYNEAQRTIKNFESEKKIKIIQEKRIIGCTTTAAAMYSHELRAASPDVLLVEEAGEILESHILTALGSETDQLILIGDHKQLRPKVANYDLTVAKMTGYDLDRSLFERLVLKGFPHKSLTQQFRMRPEISRLVRHLTYPELTDADSTKGRENIRGLENNVVFIHHTNPEGEEAKLVNHKDMGLARSSKKNKFEAGLVLKIVKYLGQQGYGTKRLVVLSPYLGQLSLLREVLGKENDPVLNDLDSHDLVRAGLISPAAAALKKKPVYLSSIDNYQGEEADIVVISMTRSNPSHDIGFMSDPNRLTVMLSRARNGLILVGNADTFRSSRKGKEVWTQFFNLLNEGGNMYKGLPVKCVKHPEKTTLLCRPADFDEECPGGGCKEPCNAMLNCGKHKCPQSCHQIDDHSLIKCKFIIEEKCPEGHKYSWMCYENPLKSCPKCDRIEKLRIEKLQREYELEQKREEEQRQHARLMEEMDQKIAEQREAIKQSQLRRARELALRQKERDLEDARNLAMIESSPLPPAPVPPAPPQSSSPVPNVISRIFGLKSPLIPTPLPQPKPTAAQVTNPPRLMKKSQSPSANEWQRQKAEENARNPGIDAIMDMIGLEDVKEKILKIKDKIDASIRQGTDLKNERMGLALLGNPGTGKTTVARSYGIALSSLGVLSGQEFVETTGSWLSHTGISGAKKFLDQIINGGGGVFFIDEAYQLTDGNNPGGKQVLDFLLAEIENTVGKVVFIIAGYNKQMESFFEHNPGIPSRIPWTLRFNDYKDFELLEILSQIVEKKYSSRMQMEDGIDGLYMRIVSRRIGRGRGTVGFGNARAVHNVFSRISERQAERLARERRGGGIPDDFYFTQEDLIGPDPSKAVIKSKALGKLQELIGLDTVKQSVQSIIDAIVLNYKRELEEKNPVQDSLNRVFLGSPGTGKTTVAQLVGQIYADCGVLSNGEVVVKNPSDFIGSHLGETEKNTKEILDSTIGKVLIIDEAYGLYSAGNGHGGNNSDQFKTAAIDTLVAGIQSVPGEDRCVLLLGYKDQMTAMFDNVNPGLARRFRIEDAFHFQDFTNEELLKILDLKLKHQELDATPEAKLVAIEVLGRVRRRPNFGNAGEVENVLSKAKTNHRLRESKKPVDQRAVDIVFEPEDFDQDFNRGSNTAATNAKQLFADVIGCDEIATKLESYQQIVRNMNELGEDPMEQVPTNFIFKGPPGTGKTTIARKMGQIYYDMGFLASAEVVECSASDLVAQYVGQTGPKTRKLLEKALGKVLFIDEAYRLGEGHFAAEAIDELVDVLTKPQFAGKIIVILAGYDADMNRLMSTNSGLSSRFPEEVIFKNMPPEHCIQLLDKDLQRKNIEIDEIKNPQCAEYIEISELITKLSSLPSWGNARDVKTLAKNMIGTVFKSSSMSKTRNLPVDEALKCIKSMLAERESRVVNVSSSNRRIYTQPVAHSQNSARPPSPPAVKTATATQTKKPSAPPPPPPPPPPQAPPHPASPSNGTPTGPRNRRRGRGRQQVQRPPVQRPPSQCSNPNTNDEGRDPGVSDEIWTQLQSAKRANAESEAQYHRMATQLNRQISSGENREREAARAAAAAEQEKKDLERIENEARARARQAQAEAERKQHEARAREMEAQRRQKQRMIEEAKRRERQARVERNKLEAKRRAEQERRNSEARAQQKLRNMGVCVQGFQWIKSSGGYRCAGGGHFVSDAQLR